MLIRKQPGRHDQAMSRMNRRHRRVSRASSAPVNRRVDVRHDPPGRRDDDQHPSRQLILGSEFWQLSTTTTAIPCLRTSEQWPVSSAASSTSWWGPNLAEVQKVWLRFTQMAPLPDGIAGLISLLRKRRPACACFAVKRPSIPGVRFICRLMKPNAWSSPQA
ncbi:MAG: hypothetical protein H6700_12415 [Myxococcales bacterium]|nr:hypothetical protein [Myxococcales bacterium]